MNLPLLPPIKQFNRTQISRDDFARALRFIKTARPYDTASTEYEALLIAAVISYARPFSNNERDKNAQAAPRLSPNLIPFKGKQRKLHERVIVLRNKAVAHGEFAFNPVHAVPPFVAGEGDRILGTWSQRWHIGSERLNLDEFEHIAAEMHQQCENHLLELRVPKAAKNRAAKHPRKGRSK